MKRTWPAYALLAFLLQISASMAGSKGDGRIILRKTNPSKPVYFNQVTRREGLPGGVVLCAVQDHEGFMWFGTENGLVRYDGTSVLVLQHDAGDPYSIIENPVSALAVGPDSMIWAGTLNGLSIVDPVTLMSENYPLTSSYHDSRKVKCIYTGDPHSAWVGTQNGLFRMDLPGRRLTHFLGSAKEYATTRESRLNEVAFVLPDPRDGNHLLLGTNGGLVLFDKPSGKIIRDYEHIIPPYRDTHYGAYSAWIDDSMRLWTHGWISGINIFDLRTETWTDLAFSDDLPAISRIIPDRGNILWVATLNSGIFRVDLRRSEYSQYTSTSTKEKSLVSDYIAYVTFDRDGTLWVMGEGGVSIEDKEFRKFRQVRVPLRHNWISAFYKDPATKRFYVGAYDCDGLFCQDETTGKWSVIPPDVPCPPGSFCINTLFCDRDNVLWVGSRSSLYRLDEKRGRLVLFRTKDDRPLELHDKVIYAVMEDREGNLWVGTRFEGIVRIDASRSEALYFRHSDNDTASLLEGTHIRGIAGDRQGRLWIGTSRGFCLYDPKTGKFSTEVMRQAEVQGFIRRYVNSIRCDSLGRMWLSCDRQGMLRVETAPGKKPGFRFFTTRQGLYDAELLYFSEDPMGNFWIVNHALVCMNPYRETFRIFSVYNGLHETATGDVKTYVDREGNIYFGDEREFETINSAELDGEAGHFNLVMEGIDVNGERYGQFSRSMPDGKIYIFPANERNLTFRFTAVNFSQPVRVSYQYFLEGYDKAWSRPGESREARYTNLPAGSYTFRVRAVAGGGLANIEKIVRFSVREHFYRTWWFLLGVLAAITALGWILYSYRKRQRMRLEQLRTRIASDLHDDVSSTLSSISILSSLVAGKTKEPGISEMIAEIGNSARNMLEQTDDIIWAVNPRNDRFQDLGLRIREYAIPLFESKNIAFRIECPESLGGVRIPMDVRRNIYLIAKEAVNNLVKYSECTRAEIRFAHDHSTVSLEITDDGKGFDPSKDSPRNGLRNMALRAQRISAALSVNSAPGQGTWIRVEHRIR